MPRTTSPARLLSALALILGLMLAGVASAAAQDDDDPDGDGSPFNTAFIGSANQSDDESFNTTFIGSADQSDAEADATSDDESFNTDFIGSADDDSTDRPPREPVADTGATDSDSDSAVLSMPNTGAGMVDTSPALLTLLIGAFAVVMVSVAGGSAVRGLRGSNVRSR